VAAQRCSGGTGGEDVIAAANLNEESRDGKADPGVLRGVDRKASARWTADVSKSL
jgi:hypothetical protein